LSGDVLGAAVVGGICAILDFAGSVFASLPTKALFLELKNQAGKKYMDPIADMLIRIKNATLVKKESVSVPYSKFKAEVASILKEKGYLSSAESKGRKNRKFLELEIAYDMDGEARFHDVKKISKPSRRVYKKVSELRPVRRGYGLAIISTSKGLRTDEAARREKIGGEILCEIW